MPEPDDMARQQALGVIHRVSSAIARADQHLLSFFRALDLDGDGRLSKDELSRMLLTFEPKLSVASLDVALLHFDSDRDDGMVDVSDFYNGFASVARGSAAASTASTAAVSTYTSAASTSDASTPAPCLPTHHCSGKVEQASTIERLTEQMNFLESRIADVQTRRLDLAAPVGQSWHLQSSSAASQRSRQIGQLESRLAEFQARNLDRVVSRRGAQHQAVPHTRGASNLREDDDEKAAPRAEPEPRMEGDGDPLQRLSIAEWNYLRSTEGLDLPPKLAVLMGDLSKKHPSLMHDIRHAAGNGLKFQYLQECMRLSDMRDVDDAKDRVQTLWESLCGQDRSDIAEAYNLSDGRRDAFFLQIVEDDRRQRRKLCENGGRPAAGYEKAVPPRNGSPARAPGCGPSLHNAHGHERAALVKTQASHQDGTCEKGSPYRTSSATPSPYASPSVAMRGTLLRVGRPASASGTSRPKRPGSPASTREMPAQGRRGVGSCEIIPVRASHDVMLRARASSTPVAARCPLSQGSSSVRGTTPLLARRPWCSDTVVPNSNRPREALGRHRR